MAVEEYLQIIQQGVDTWNQWREKNPKLSGVDFLLDLSGADLSEADLMKANLTGVYLGYASLNRACLSGTDLSEANLTGSIPPRNGPQESEA